MRGMSALYCGGEVSPSFASASAQETGLGSIGGLLPYSVSICKRESIEGHHTYFWLFSSGVQSPFDSCSVNLPTAFYCFLCEERPMSMAEDIKISKVVPIDEYAIILPGAAVRFLSRNKELLLCHRFSFHFLAHIHSFLEHRIE